MYYDCFDYFSTDVHNFDSASFKQQFQMISDRVTDKDLMIGIGGGSSILNMLVSLERKDDLIIKVSPYLSRGSKDQKLANSNYISYLPDEVRSKIVHFGVLDYTNSQQEVNEVTTKDKSKIVYLDKLGKSNA